MLKMIGQSNKPKTGSRRFEKLLSRSEWNQLPAATRLRFSAKLSAGESLIFRGATTRLKMNFIGAMLSQLARIAGAPLPVDEGIGGRAAVVVVTDATDGASQIWTRLYSRRDGFPQAIHSAKKFAGPTGLEEHVVDGRWLGLGMTLTLRAAAGALYFTSDRYFIQIAKMRLYLPRVLSPGEMTIGHQDLGHSRFLFTLSLRHSVFGLMIDQETVFEDMESIHA